MHKEYAQTADQVLSDLQSGPEGLSAAQAEGRLAEYGPNRLREAPKATLLQRFLQQLRDPMLLILMAAAAVSAVTNYLSHEPFTEVLIILAVVLLNAVLGVVQESKAEAAIEALQTMTAATSKVLRDGSVTELESSCLVPGDIVLLEAGDAVPADGRLLACASLQIEEAALTGESVPSAKSPEALTGEVTLGDRRNMAYMGSTVAYGRGRMVVTATGMDTEMGKIAGVLARTEQEETPLQKKLTQLGKTLSWLVLGICVFIFVFDLIVAGDFSLSGILETFMVAVSLAVAAIPEGLATVVTVVLSIGVTRMSRRNAVIRRLTAVETDLCRQNRHPAPEQDDRGGPHRGHRPAGLRHGSVQRRRPEPRRLRPGRAYGGGPGILRRRASTAQAPIGAGAPPHRRGPLRLRPQDDVHHSPDPPGRGAVYQGRAGPGAGPLHPLLGGRTGPAHDRRPPPGNSGG